MASYCRFSEGLAGIVERFLKKGSKVYVEGSLQTRKWTGNDGIEKYTTEIVLQGFNGTLTMLDGRGDGGGTDGGGKYDGGSDSNSAPDWDTPSSSPGGGDADLDDDIPF